MKTLHIVSFILVIVGGLNWLLVGLLDFNLVNNIFGSMYERLIYILVGVSAVYVMATHANDCKVCSSKKK